MLKIGDTVKIIDNWKEVRENSSNRQGEYYAKLANPNKEYTIRFITPSQEVYVEGITNSFKYNLLERV